MRKLVATIRSCDIGFDVWEPKNPADKKGSGTYEFTSLMGNDKKKLLKFLPEKLPTVLRPNTCSDVSRLWADFRYLYHEIHEWSPQKSPECFFSKTGDWLQNFLSLRGKRIGYEKKRVTPYMHILFAHVPYFLATYQSLKVFTGQGVEKNNDIARNVVRHKTNHCDSTGDILRIEHRQWLLQHREREHRMYCKLNSQYWENDIFIQRAKKKKQFQENAAGTENQESTILDPPPLLNNQSQAAGADAQPGRKRQRQMRTKKTQAKKNFIITIIQL